MAAKLLPALALTAVLGAASCPVIPPEIRECKGHIVVVTNSDGKPVLVCVPPSPSPSPEPSSAPPVPSPTPPPSSPTPSPPPTSPPPPSPTPVPSATPTPMPTTSACPRPDDTSLAPNTPVKKDPGYRNTFDVSPWFEGQKIRPESGCTRTLVETYGEFEGLIIINGQRSGFEHQGCSLEDVRANRCDHVRWEDFYLYVDATNSDDGNWDHGTYLQAGPRTYCTSYKHLAHYKCINCTMTTEGKVIDCGPRYDLNK